MKLLLNTIKIIIIAYLITCFLLFFFQEKLIFFPEKLGKSHQFIFEQTFEEINIETKDHKLLSALLFRADSSKGLVFYLHGNAGSLNSWGHVSQAYIDLGYDVFMMDYRGYGKSEGSIDGQKQLFTDIQTAYDLIKERYQEDKIIVLGYSIGTGLAAKIAATNNPGLLILQAPYFSLTDIMRHTYPIIPAFILKYKLPTGDYTRECKMPVIIFHGKQDEVIYYGSSLKLKDGFKKQDTLITLYNQAHNGMTDNPEYRIALKKILTK